MSARSSPWLRTRRQASGLLLVMAGLFLVARLTEPAHPALGFVRAFAEAALVGGLADWFAVTALFRHPLGLPIPHTAIIPNNRERLADSVAGFLRQHFLSRRVVIAEMVRHDLAGLLADWLLMPQNRRWLAGRATGLLGRELTPAPWLAEWLAALLAQQRHQVWFDGAIAHALQWLDEHHADIYQKVSEKSPRWMPRRFNDEFYQRLMAGVGELLDDMLAPDSAARAQFEQALRTQVARLAAGEFDAQISQQLSAAVQEGHLPQRLEAALAEFALRIRSDQALHAQLNRWLQRQATVGILRRRGQITGLVRQVILGWDPATVASRMEGQVGQDLQFIRISGTLVGGLVGLMLHALSLLLVK